MDRCRLRRHQSLTASSARAYRPLAVTCLTPFTPFFDLAQIWEKPRKLSVTLSLSGWHTPPAMEAKVDEVRLVRVERKPVPCKPPSPARP